MAEGESQFDSYEGELKLVFADLNQKLDALDTSSSSSTSAEERKSSIRAAERALEEAKELLDQLNLSKSSIPTTQRTKINARYRNHASDLDGYTRKLKQLKNAGNVESDRAQLFGERYTDDPNDATLEQRQQLLSGTERLGRSGERLRESQRIALETEAIGAGTLADLHQQRNVIENTHRNLLQSEGYVDRSVKTLRGMARR
jgi:vesicle transport through interaction with t-SNAREs 1